MANAKRIAGAQYEAQKRDVISMWTVYDHPSDFPHSYVARRFEVIHTETRMTEDIVQGELRIIRESFRHAGLHRLTRFPADDPKIVEVWL